MAVSRKKVKPTIPDIATSLSLVSSGVEKKSEAVSIQPETHIETEKKNINKDTQIIFRTTEENKNSLKGFFASNGLTMSKGIQLACFYLEQQIKNGNVEISPTGFISNKK